MRVLTVKPFLIRAIATLAGFAIMATVGAQTINAPIVVPLHLTLIDTGTYKLGIYATIGDGATPALFEFDTGATGFYATYSPNQNVSPWWGSGVNSLQMPVDASYASGLHYTGNLVEAPVTLYGSSDPSSALVAFPATARIGQMDSIVDEKNGNAPIWDANGSVSGNPPVNGAFYGDFGMGLIFTSHGITNLLAQLDYGPRVVAGFRIHVDPVRQNASVQIGLTWNDVWNPYAFYFSMNVDPMAGGALSPGSGTQYFSQQVFNATINIADRKSLKSRNVGMITDTGATTELHNTQESPGALPKKYDALINWDNQQMDAGELKSGLNFALSGRTIWGKRASFFSFETTSVFNAGRVGVSNDGGDYFLNTGISFFYPYDVIYNLRDGTIGLVPDSGS